MVNLLLHRTHELTFHVESPILNDINPTSTSSSTNQSDYDDSYWTVNLSRSGQSLSVKVGWYSFNTSSYRHVPEGGTYAYTFMHIVPRGNGEETATTSITFRNISGTASVSDCKDLAHRSTPKNLSSVVSTKRDMLLSLLKDVHSVDTCFVFTSDKTYPKVGLWAHRAILSRYKVFEELILETTRGLKTISGPESTKTYTTDEDEEQEEAKEPSTPSSSGKDETSAMSSILTIQVDKFTLATMCSVLYFIYAGDVQLSIAPSQFAISKAESTLVLYDTQGKTRESVRWDPLSTDSAWKLKDVTWQELGLAAEFYGLGELGTLCEKEVSEMLNESNAIDILFNVGCHSEKVKQVLDYIVEHMGSLFVGDNNPFEAFRDHPACHDMLIEVLRVKATKKA
ncbi:MAG: hypothetical protein J3Q66DRAFT_407021 [Benniella sp.]|nr:MAG: hypothetical protein J3Q66DRAFT_407021 [Benniella sp.]